MVWLRPGTTGIRITALGVLSALGLLVLGAGRGVGVESSRGGTFTSGEWHVAEPSLHLVRQPPRTRSKPDTVKEVDRLVFEETNTVRVRHNLRPLERDSGLVRVACAHSRDMLAHGFFGHVNLRQRDVSDRVGLLHRRLIGAVGENVLGRVGSPALPEERRADQMVRQWMGSEEHRRNILGTDFTHMGVCTARMGEIIRVTQVFAIVRAYLAEPLPYRIQSGSDLSVTVVPVTPSTEWPEKYDLWNPLRERQYDGPYSFNEPLHFPERPGRYRLRFYFPREEGHRVFFGPEVRIVAPD